MNNKLSGSENLMIKKSKFLLCYAVTKAIQVQQQKPLFQIFAAALTWIFSFILICEGPPPQQ